MWTQVDKLGYKEQEVSLLVKLGRLEEGAELYKVLLAMNPDNYRYFFSTWKVNYLSNRNDGVGV